MTCDIPIIFAANLDVKSPSVTFPYPKSILRIGYKPPLFVIYYGHVIMALVFGVSRTWPVPRSSVVGLMLSKNTTQFVA